MGNRVVYSVGMTNNDATTALHNLRADLTRKNQYLTEDLASAISALHFATDSFIEGRTEGADLNRAVDRITKIRDAITTNHNTISAVTHYIKTVTP